jgi:hypothetical protein
VAIAIVRLTVLIASPPWYEDIHRGEDNRKAIVRRCCGVYSRSLWWSSEIRMCQQESNFSDPDLPPGIFFSPY